MQSPTVAVPLSHLKTTLPLMAISTVVFLVLIYKHLVWVGNPNLNLVEAIC